ncbi:MAG: TAXI family TRAP transporter solute-binding subunit [Loktanella sp.]|nr:TAXI family TRAP transporter solute-binding subunit [Loktanella sp.]
MLKLINRQLRSLLAAAVMTAVSTTALTAQDIRIGAMREGSSWYVFAATLQQMIEPILGSNSVEIIARGGGVANPMVVQGGRAEIALSNVASAVWAANGDDVYEGMSAPDIRALVGGLNDVFVGVMATDAFVARQGTTDLAEIVASGAPIRILIKPVGSSAVPVAYMILEGLGTSVDEIRANGGDIVQVDTGQIADQMRNGNADIYIDTMIQGHPAITEVALTTNVTFLDIPQAAMDVLEANGLTPGAYGPEWYKGQTTATTGANLGTVLIANASLDEETAYLITKTIMENAEALKSSHGAWSAFDPTQAMIPENTGIALHPGAVRYYEEAGLM